MGGMEGEYILHHHSEDCFVKYDEDYLASGKAAVTESERTQEYNEDGSIFIKQWDSAEEDAAYTELCKMCKSSLIDTEGLSSMYAEFIWSNCFGRPNLSRTTLKILDQNGRILKEQNAEQLMQKAVFENGASIEQLFGLCMKYDAYGAYEAWLEQFSGYTFSDLDIEFSLQINPAEEGHDIFHIRAYPVTDGTKNWVHVELIDLGDNNRVYENEDGTAYQCEGIYSSVELTAANSMDGGHDIWNRDNPGVKFTMRVGCELDSSVTGVSVEAQAAMDKDATGFHNETLSSIVMRTDRKVCGMEEGQVVSARPAYGGSSYINMEYAIAHDSAAGCVRGNGSAAVKAEMTGLTEAQELKGVMAPDLAAPPAVAESGVRKTAQGANHVLITFQPVEDRGSTYYFKAESYSARTGELMCTSNTAKNVLKTGLRGYLYLIDQNPSTRVTASGAANGSSPLAEERVAVEIKPYTQYLHLAALDRAGNLSETTHVKISLDDPELFWLPYTEDIAIDGTVGGRDYGGIYPGEDDRTYYVKADGATPFLLSFGSYLEGAARADYQIDYQIFDIRRTDGAEMAQRHISKLPYTNPLDSEVPVDSTCLVRQTEGQAVLQDAMYIGAARSHQAEKVSFYQAFTVEGTWSGESFTVTPVVGATALDDILYSSWELDTAHALRLVADGTAPVITGLDAFQDIKLIDRTKKSIVVEVTAYDELSGVRDFALQVENLDNYSTAVYTADENGVVRVEVTKDEPLFSGDFMVTAYASDNVGNEAKEDWYVTEFALEAEVQRILAPHDPVFKRGESGILSVTAWGYVDSVEVEFPDFLSEYNQTLDYLGYSDYKEDEKLQFMIPLYAAEGEDYTITVRARKGDRQLELYPTIWTIQVKDSVLDEIRTRLRG